jgi:hypothetical protein
MHYSLNGVKEYGGLLCGFSYSPYVQRHRQLSNGSWNGHRILAMAEGIPLLGAIVALIEKVVISCWRAFFPSVTTLPLPVKKFEQLSLPAQAVRQRPPAFQQITDQQLLRNHNKLVVQAKSYQHEGDHSVSYNAAFGRIAVVLLAPKRGTAAGQLVEIRHRTDREYGTEDYLIYTTQQFKLDMYGVGNKNNPIPSEAMMTVSPCVNMQQQFPLFHQAVPFYKSALYVNGLYNFFMADFRAGSALVQLAIEESLVRGFEGRIYLKAVRDSSEFYKKLGFIHSPEDNHYMYLPEEAIEEWRIKIAANPLRATSLS